VTSQQLEEELALERVALADAQKALLERTRELHELTSSAKSEEVRL
jgi:hypothetical protein